MIKTEIADGKYAYPYVCANISNDDYTTYPVDTDGNVTQVDVIENGKLFKFITPANAKARMDKQMVDNLKVGNEATDESESTGKEPVEETPNENVPSTDESESTGKEPTDEKPTESTPTDEKPTESTPTDEKPTESTPTDEKPTESSSDETKDEESTAGGETDESGSSTGGINASNSFD